MPIDARRLSDEDHSLLSHLAQSRSRTRSPRYHLAGRGGLIPADCGLLQGTSVSNRQFWLESVSACTNLLILSPMATIHHVDDLFGAYLTLTPKRLLLNSNFHSENRHREVIALFTSEKTATCDIHKSTTRRRRRWSGNSTTSATLPQRSSLPPAFS